MSQFPRQKLSSAEKEKRDDTTGKNQREATVDYFIDETIQTTKRDTILKDYRTLEGHYDEADYNHVLNPLNTTIDRYKKFGAKMRNYDILSPVINLYAGEFSQRFKNFQVIDSNPSDDNRYKEGLNLMIKNFYNQQTVNHLNSLGINTGQESQEQGTIQEATDTYNRDFDSNRVITGQEILDYIYYDQDIDDKHQDAYLDWLKCGATISYKGVFHNDVDYEVVPPWQVTLPDTITSNFVEDADWVVRRQVLKANQILDRWHDKFSDDDVTWLENESQKDAFTNKGGFVSLPTKWISNKEDYANHSIINEINGIEVFHVQWRTFRKVGLLSFVNEVGQPDEIEVDDTYKLNKDNGDISIEWGWISQVEEGWRIGDDTNSIYVDVRPLPYNRMELNNSSSQKLSYNGRLNKGVSGKLISIPSLGRPYQLLFNIVHYQFEKTINKNKEKIMIMPQGLFPKGVGGWDEEKAMYYANADGMLVIDETQPTAGLALQGIKVLDMSLGNYIKDSLEILSSIKNEWWEAIGMNRQRYGDSKASDGKAVTEQAVYRSAIISEELNRKFEKFQEKDYAGLLDISKVAYIEGKKAKYINSDGREAFLKMNPDNAVFHLESDYNIHVKNSRKESENIQMAKDYGFSIAQNADAPTMMELIGSTNFAKTAETVKKIDAQKKQAEQMAQESAQQSNEAIANTTAETQKAKNDVEVYKADRDYDKAIDVKMLEIENQPQPDIKDEGDTDGMNTHKKSIDNANLALDKRDMNRKEKETTAKIKQMKEKKTNNNN